DCYISIGLDKRKSYAGEYKLCVRFTLNRKVLYWHLGALLTPAEFEEVSEINVAKGHRGRISRKAAMKVHWIQLLDNYAKRVNDIACIQPLSLDAIRAVLSGKNLISKNLLTIWKDYASGKKPGTQLIYLNALKDFKNFSGYRDEDGFQMSAKTVNDWKKRMEEHGYNNTTICMRLQALRIIVNLCVKEGLMQTSQNIFSNMSKDKVSLPVGLSRNHMNLAVEQWRNLYDMFVKDLYPIGWTSKRKSTTKKVIGVFLGMYLGNGMNFVDLARLRYDDFYLLNKGEAFLFYRTKTRDRTVSPNGIVVPIIPELKTVIKEIGAPYEKDGLVFPFILQGARTEAEQRHKIAKWHSINNQYLKMVAKEMMGLDISLSETWARHSFATVLSHAEVPTEYISESMGHSLNRSITHKYIGRIPLEKAKAYNSLLLKNQNEKMLETIMMMNNKEKILIEQYLNLNYQK
nr:hypothetical protein [Bacteroidaceae bacterium]